MDTFQALAEPRRREIVELLAKKGRLSATDISENFSISAPAISQHLKILREAKLVDMEKHAQKRIYALNPDTISDIEEWIGKLRSLWSKRFERLDSLLQKRGKHGRP
ncbi:MAG: ArsR/SmtB family transcription factor [Candidatus Levyibacteriota bacterium]